MVRQYELVRHISTGRFGDTMLVKMSGQLAVMKTVDVSRLEDPSKSGEVVQELKAAAALPHPHLLAVVECFRQDGVLCVVTEYCEAGHVAARLEVARSTGVELKQELLFHWFTQALLAVSFLHDRGCLHRDLRARRLLLAASGQVQLSGVAVSTLLQRALRASAPDLEAVRYLAPELVAATSSDRDFPGSGAATASHTGASDLWALGVILFELLTLRPPYTHPHPRSLAEHILAGPPPLLPPGRGVPQVRQLCASLLQRDPGQRPSASDVLRDPFMQAEVRSLLNVGQAAPNLGIAPLVVARMQASLATTTPPAAQPCPVLSSAARKCTVSPLMLSTPAATPRSLRHVGEACSRRSPTAQELRKPKAFEPHNLRQSFAKAMDKKHPNWAADLLMVSQQAKTVPSGGLQRLDCVAEVAGPPSPREKEKEAAPASSSNPPSVVERLEDTLEVEGRCADLLDRGLSQYVAELLVRAGR